MKPVLKASAPLLAALVALIAVQLWWSRGYSTSGHAAEHLSSATLMFGMAFVLSAIVWALPGRVRDRPGLWVLLAFVAVAAAVNAQGNLQVVEAIGDEDWSLEDVDVFGPTRDGFEEGHDRAEQGGLAGVVAAGAVIVWLGARRVISGRLCIGGVVACLFFPYWLFPGFGLVVVAGFLVVRRVRREREAAALDPSGAGTVAARPT
jgi:UPF0716 family protein affecting phage T7 exclusion